MIRYFKMISHNQTITIWAMREDGKERCLRDNPVDEYRLDEWTDPKKQGDAPLLIMMEDKNDCVEEITKDEAFLEMI